MDGYINRQILQDIADAIREKNGSEETYKPSEMAEAILDLSGNINLQYKSVTITENGTQTITADEGFDGLNSVEVNANVAPPPFGLIGWDVNDISYYNARLAEAIAYSKTLYDAWNPNNTSAAWFYATNKKIVYAPHIDTSKVTNMTRMFNQCICLTTIPLLDTSKVTNMNAFFWGCTALKSIPLLDTSRVNTFEMMFYQCNALLEIPLLNTSNVTTMKNMFAYCSVLTTIPHIDTSKVTNMSRMFNICPALKSIPLLDTSEVTDMSYMFDGCSALQEIPQLDTTSNTITRNMFFNCSSLVTVPLLNMLKVTDTIGMFANCSNLENLGGFVNCKVALNLSASTKLTHDSLINVINNLYDLASNGLATKTLTLGTTNLAKLTEEEQAIAANKGWTLA